MIVVITATMLSIAYSYTSKGYSIRSVSLLRTSRLLSSFQDTYEYIDCGDGKRLERFGGEIVIRPCPIATSWSKTSSLSALWNDRNAIIYDKKSSAETGKWLNVDTSNSSLDSNQWIVKFNSQIFRLFPSEQGQLGIFPEQSVNWKWITDTIKHRSKDEEIVNVLNGFCYTGGSSLAAMAASNSTRVVSLDAAKNSIQWAKNNAAISGYTEAGGRPYGSNRWIVDDCMTFLEREVRRNNKYECLIFDPPAFGKGGGSKVWKLDTDLLKLVSYFPKLLSDKPIFILLTCHDINWPANKLADLLANTMRDAGYRGRISSGSLGLGPEDGGCGNRLDLGVYARYVME